MRWSYTYEDFFEGYRPRTVTGGQLSFELRPGPLRALADAAREDPQTPYILVIDEVNRANLAKVFGDFYFLLEYREESIGLQYSPDDKFNLPRNLYLIGTMNTADRSIALVDTAMRRRFAFVEMHPRDEPVRGLLRRWLERHGYGDQPARLLDAGRYVGVARVGDLEVRIAPKVAVDRLLFLVGYATSGRHWRDGDLRLGEAPQLVPVLAEALWRQIERALRHGLLQGHRAVDESAAVLRGRLREADQMHRHRGQPGPLEIRHDEFTVDIPENQILRTAVERMRRIPRVDPATRQRLRHLSVRLADASPLPRGLPAPAWHPSRLNARYQPALRLAELVLRTTSIEYGEGGPAVNGLLLDMPKVFEDFVTTALREELEATHGGRVRSQLVRHLDVAGRVTIVPDIVWLRARQIAAVVDAKYKAENPAGYPNADLYQLLAYCTALGLPRGHLVYAAGSGNPAVHTVRNTHVEISCNTLDLATPPANLLAQLRGLATRLATADLSNRAPE